ncbi:MAG TPA: hypothetical protein VKT73_12815 [Xanthobacteraceae bacterium]|nr:hypothetical protein [Xanthobacteraceae bacterium]
MSKHEISAQSGCPATIAVETGTVTPGKLVRGKKTARMAPTLVQTKFLLPSESIAEKSARPATKLTHIKGSQPGDSIADKKSARKTSQKPPISGKMSSEDFGQAASNTQLKKPSLDRDRTIGSTQITAPASDQNFTPIEQIVSLWPTHRAWEKLKIGIDNRARAFCARSYSHLGQKESWKKGGDALKRIISGDMLPEDEDKKFTVLPIIALSDSIENEIKELDKYLGKIAKTIPIATWFTGFRGLGIKSLVRIIGECGDISKYSSFSALYKRLGLAPVKGADGTVRACATWRKMGATGLSKSEWENAGYSPRRRAAAHLIEDNLVGYMKRPLVGEDIEKNDKMTCWQKMFVSRCRYEVQNNPEFAREPVMTDGQLRESYAEYAAIRASRYVVKKFLKAMFQEWRRLELIQRAANSDPK